MFVSGRAYSDGEIFKYHGRPLILRSSRDGDDLANSAAALGDHLVVRTADPNERKTILLRWYTAETELIVRSLVPKWSKKLSVRPRCAVVKYASTRWGSCSQSGRIFLNSRLAMLSPGAAEYIVVHELCHLKHMHHGPAFWDEVKRALPSARELRRSLREQEKYTVL
jgi:predicted metal-dependent hydrolase